MKSTTMTESWSSIHLRDDRHLLYGPRLGRAYLLPQSRFLDPAFIRLAGLRGACYQEVLPDPVQGIARTLEHSHLAPVEKAPMSRVLGYRCLHLSRHVIPLRLMARMLRRLARLQPPLPPPDCPNTMLADALHAIERSLGAGDCYPRALMTMFLSIRLRRACTLVLGALTPTRKMHVWCVVDGVLPYEPLPEHYLYQPLWALQLKP